MQYSYIMALLKYLYINFLPMYGIFNIVEVFMTHAKMIGSSRIHSKLKKVEILLRKII